MEHVPPDFHVWGELVNRRRFLVQRRTEAKISLRALLRRAGASPPSKPGIWTKAGLNWLESFHWPTSQMAVRADALLREIQSLDKEVRQIEAELRRIGNSPAVVRLVRLTGLGFRTAEAVLASLEEWRRRHPSDREGRPPSA